MPENALLSHDLFEGLYARTALVTDIEVVDDYPSSVLAHARRQHRWVRGDWQILWWLFPFVPSRTGMTRNRLPLIARWKILDNLRRSLLPPATCCCSCSAGPSLPGHPAVWTAAALGGAGLSRRLCGCVGLLRGPRAGESWGVFVRTRGRGSEDGGGARVGCSSRSWPTRRASGCTRSAITLVRLGVTQRRLLEWETTAASAARGGPVHGARVRHDG